MEGINKVIIVGNLGRRPDLIDASGTSILRMSVGVSERYKGKSGWVDKTTWIPVSLFGKRAEKLSNILRTGTLVAIEGRLNPRSFVSKKDNEKKYVIDVQANQKFSFWTPGAKEPTEVSGESEEEPPPPDMPPFPDDEDIPF